MPALRDLDYLSARLHGRRARLADGPRLAALCALGSPAALASALLPGAAAPAPAELRRVLVRAFIAEARWIAASLGGAWGEYASWQAERFRLRNVKTALRGLLSGASRQALAAALAGLPPGEGCGPELASAADARALPELLPPGPLQESLEAALAEGKDIFLTEAALDRDYLAAQAALAAALGGADGEIAAGLAAQESAAFNLAAAARGRFFHSYPVPDLKPLYAPGQAMPPRRYSALLAAVSAAELRELAAGSAVDGGPPETDPAALEALARRRYARLAARGFRRAGDGRGLAAAYLALRLVELDSLASVAEGLRLGIKPAALARRLQAEAANA